MPGSSRLETTIMQLNGDIKSKQHMVDSLQASAKTHAENGDDASAQTDQASAERYIKDVNNLQSQIASMQTMVQVKRHKAKTIKEEMEQMTKQYEQDIAKLKSERDSLV